MTQPKRAWTPRHVRETAVARMLAIGFTAASLETGFRANTLKRWRYEFFGAAQQQRSTVDRALAFRLAESVGVNEAARRLGVHACQISRWRRAAGLPAIGASSAKGVTVYPRLFVRRALKLADHVGLAVAAERVGVGISTLSRWRRDRRPEVRR